MVEEVFLAKKKEELCLKKAIANILYKKKFEQQKIAKILNLSQPMVSNYCKSKNNVSKKILNKANNISEKIIENKGSCLFQTCITFDKNLDEDRYFIATENEIIKDENKEIIDNLADAFLLIKDKEFKKILPEVKINLAMAKQNAKNSDDVASFINGLVIADDKIVAHNGIRYGKSKHLSNLLLYLKDKMDISAVMNVKYLNFDNKNFVCSSLTKDFKIKNSGKKVDILLHKGDFGIEPCAYILGENAVDVVNKVTKIIVEMK